jgi:hypothetical protein
MRGERRNTLEVLEHVFERLDVAELRVDVEAVPLDRARDASPSHSRTTMVQSPMSVFGPSVMRGTLAGPVCSA